MLARIIIGLLVAFAGFMMVWKSEWLYQNMGSNDWAETKFGSFGGTRTMYKAMGLIVIIIGFLTVTDLHKAAFKSMFGWLFPQTSLHQDPNE
jgi:multisubunit Na+/H+ antiporter MnhB subunit